MRTKSYDAFESINHPYVAYIHGETIHYQYELQKPSGKLQFDASLCPDVFC